MRIYKRNRVKGGEETPQYGRVYEKQRIMTRRFGAGRGRRRGAEDIFPGILEAFA